MNDCLFCKIVRGEVPSNAVYQDETVFAFYDVNPQAPVHILLIPKVHIGSIDDVSSENALLIAHIYTVIAKLSKQLRLEDGYRVVSNCGVQGGQTVPHLHFHLLAGRNLSWPPG